MNVMDTVDLKRRQHVLPGAGGAAGADPRLRSGDDLPAVRLGLGGLAQITKLTGTGVPT